MAGQKNHSKAKIVSIILAVLVVLAGLTVFVLSMTKPEKEVNPNFDITIPTESEGESDPYAHLENESKADYPVSELESLDVNVFEDSEWVHYLLIGLDNRKDTFEGGRSDALMIFSVNDTNGRVVLSSIPRDTYVYINGKGYDKITHTYAYGKAKLLVETVERNMDIDIKHYFTINFAGMEKVIDALGGVELELTQKESDHMLSFFEVGGTTAGRQVLTGKQALTFCRIRKIDSDFERTRRQYDVLMAIYDKVKVMSPIKYPALITAMYDYFYTDCSVAEAIDIAKALMALGAESIENVKLVDIDSCTPRKINGAAVLVVNDPEENMKKWREYMEVTDYVPSEGMVEISNYIKYNY